MRGTGHHPTGGPPGAVTSPRAARWRDRRRLRETAAGYLVTLLVLLTINVALPQVMPGDPLTALVTEGTTEYVHDEAQREHLRELYGLDEPLPQAIVGSLSGLLRGDLGISIRHQVPVVDLLATRLPRSLLLLGTGLALGTAFGVLTGALAGWRRGGHLDRLLLTAVTVVHSMPVYFLGSLLVAVFAVRLGWLPLGGSSTRFATAGVLETALDGLRHLTLPALVLASQFAAGPFLLMRAGMVAQQGADHLAMGRAMGLSDRVLRSRYAARNALLPVASVLGIHVGLAVTSAVLVETVFRYEGIGRLMADAVASRDYPVLQGCFLVLSLTVLVANLLVELTYRRLDPRIVP